MFHLGFLDGSGWLIVASDYWQKRTVVVVLVGATQRRNAMENPRFVDSQEKPLEFDVLVSMVVMMMGKACLEWKCRCI